METVVRILVSLKKKKNSFARWAGAGREEEAGGSLLA